MSLNDDLATRPAPPATAVLTVSQLHEDLRGALEDAGLARVWVSGVVTGLRRGARFTSWELVEYGQDTAQVRAVLSVGVFPRDLARITAVLGGAGLELADGLEVALYGRMDSNPGFGRLRLLAEGVDPRASVGAAVLARDAVVAELEATGELAAQQGLRLPAVVKRVGLVSSPTAAGRADVLTVLERSTLPMEVVEASAAMGGPQAPSEVASALGVLASAGVDVIVVARGGGARSDLAPWDSGELARAVARCPVPVWVALGHARDRTLADLAAHRSHPPRMLQRSSTSREDAAGSSPATHLRRAHWQRYRVGPRDDWRYVARWIPPVVVNPTQGGPSRRVTVYRLPVPPG